MKHFFLTLILIVTVVVLIGCSGAALTNNGKTAVNKSLVALQTQNTLCQGGSCEACLAGIKEANDIFSALASDLNGDANAPDYYEWWVDEDVKMLVQEAAINLEILHKRSLVDDVNDVNDGCYAGKAGTLYGYTILQNLKKGSAGTK